MIIVSDEVLDISSKVYSESATMINRNQMEILDTTKVLILSAIDDTDSYHLFSKNFLMYKAIDDTKVIRSKTKSIARKAFKEPDIDIKKELYQELNKRLNKAGLSMCTVFNKALFIKPSGGIKENNIYMASMNPLLRTLKDREDINIICTSKLTYSILMNFIGALGLNNKVVLMPNVISGSGAKKNISDKDTLLMLWEKNIFETKDWKSLTAGFLGDRMYHYDKDLNQNWFE